MQAQLWQAITSACQKKYFHWATNNIFWCSKKYTLYYCIIDSVLISCMVYIYKFHIFPNSITYKYVLLLPISLSLTIFCCWCSILSLESNLMQEFLRYAQIDKLAQAHLVYRWRLVLHRWNSPKITSLLLGFK